MRMKLEIVILCMVAIIAITGSLLAEVPTRSPEQLKTTATHIVTGEVLHIYQRSERQGAANYDRYLAECRVKTVEHGDGVEAGSLIYVRYFTKRNPPGVTDTAGHHGQPVQGDSVRIYLARNASEGYDDDNNDGGFNVVFPNGFEKLETP